MRVRRSREPHFPTRIYFIPKDESNHLVDFGGAKGEITIRYEKNVTNIYCGIGEKNECSPKILRSVSANGIQKALELKREGISIFPPSLELYSEDFAYASLEGAFLGAYRFTLYKTEKPKQIKTMEFVAPRLSTRKINHIRGMCDGVNLARDLVNQNASAVYPERVAEEARKIAKHGSMRCTVLDEKALKKQNLSLITAVGQGSPTPPRLILLEYNGKGTSKEKTVIVGKGVTFDSGGQDLKPVGHIETMRTDMAGAAAVLGVFKALLVLQPAINVVGVIGAAHNAIGSNSFFPGDIYPSYAGKTVEIGNTDAEGRLILADAIAYSTKKYNPTAIIDLATLTGGIIIALGDMFAGIFSNNDSLAERLLESGKRTGERLWRFPLHQDYSDLLKSEIADIRNIAKLKKGYASSIIGASFIKEFVGTVPWAHIDIAGTAYNERSQRGEIPQFGTGFGVRLVIDYLLS